MYEHLMTPSPILHEEEKSPSFLCQPPENRDNPVLR